MITAQANRNAEDGRGAEGRREGRVVAKKTWFIREFRGERTANRRERRERRGAPTQPAWARRRRLPASPEVIPGCHGRAPQEARQRRPEMEPMRIAARTHLHAKSVFLSFYRCSSVFHSLPLFLCALCGEISFPEIPEDPKTSPPIWGLGDKAEPQCTQTGACHPSTRLLIPVHPFYPRQNSFFSGRRKRQPENGR